MSALLEPIPLLRPVYRVSDIRTRQRQPKQDKLDEEPRPTAPALLLAHHEARSLATRSIWL